MKTLRGVPQSQVGCCSDVDRYKVIRSEIFDTLDNTKMCCEGRMIPRCSGSGSCPSSVEGIPNITFKTRRTDDNCCTSSSLGATTTNFLKLLGKHCSARVTAVINACHSFGSDHYGGCAVDITDVSKDCLKNAGRVLNKSYLPGTCYWEKDHYHCTLCNSNGRGAPGYDDDGSY